MKVKAWKGATYGIRVGKPNAREHFPKHWPTIIVELDGESHEFNLSETFWTTCPEFRGAAITRWLRKRGHLTWPSGNPPEFQLEHLTANRFRLLD